MNVMLCGATDIEDIVLDGFNSVSRDIGFQALNFINGDITYHNYGENKWERNSKLTVHNADLLVFVINEQYGNITWNTEFEETLSNGKNFIVLCFHKTYQRYRDVVTGQSRLPTKNQNKDLRQTIEIIQKLEVEHQITIITFRVDDFKLVLKKQLLAMFRYGVQLIEKENAKNSFLPILMSSKFNDIPKKLINEKNTRLCKEILFDFFEKKEIRKRAMEYFFVVKSLTDDEIIELCLDTEQGISRKATKHISDLINPENDLETLYNDILTSIANEEVGVVRRAIVSFFELNLEKAIKYFHLFFPTNDSGVPRRIIAKIYESREDLKRIVAEDESITLTLKALIRLCLNYNTDSTPWKEQAKLLLDEFDPS